ncbi:hypothetical protein ALP29_200147 [Pseudomonas syringae pv. avii]|uniref:Uncharacterized protein n=1 Tax=Pseudomonas syringae pv. avii TaxID=663959 RepID=A0A3M5V053_PSESX|nr:hypothetical protein ALP29_200147 [Pseudomonas syringae pv. avii]
MVINRRGIVTGAYGFLSIVPAQGGEFFLIGVGPLDLLCVRKGKGFFMIGTVHGDDLFHAVDVGPNLAVGVFELRQVGRT